VSTKEPPTQFRKGRGVCFFALPSKPTKKTHPLLEKNHQQTQPTPHPHQ